jgi:hypothetical protein
MLVSSCSTPSGHKGIESKYHTTGVVARRARQQYGVEMVKASAPITGARHRMPGRGADDKAACVFAPDAASPPRSSSSRTSNTNIPMTDGFKPVTLELPSLTPPLVLEVRWPACSAMEILR